MQKRDLRKQKGDTEDKMAKKKLMSGRLQDIEANLAIAKKKGIQANLLKIQLPFMWVYSVEEWIRILEFERKQEIERLEFFDKLKRTRK